MRVARGQYVLMVDADGATKFSNFDKCLLRMQEMEKAGKNELLMVVGSRRVEEEEGKVNRKFHRRFVSFVFKTIISILLGIKTKDTQCGFKLFTNQTAKVLFQILHI